VRFAAWWRSVVTTLKGTEKVEGMKDVDELHPLKDCVASVNAFMKRGSVRTQKKMTVDSSHLFL